MRKFNNESNRRLYYGESTMEMGGAAVTDPPPPADEGSDSTVIGSIVDLADAFSPYFQTVAGAIWAPDTTVSANGEPATMSSTAPSSDTTNLIILGVIIIVVFGILIYIAKRKKT